jgi:hypothetical protein
VSTTVLDSSSSPTESVSSVSTWSKCSAFLVGIGPYSERRAMSVRSTDAYSDVTTTSSASTSSSGGGGGTSSELPLLCVAAAAAAGFDGSVSYCTCAGGALLRAAGSCCPLDVVSDAVSDGVADVAGESPSSMARRTSRHVWHTSRRVSAGREPQSSHTRRVFMARACSSAMSAELDCSSLRSTHVRHSICCSAPPPYAISSLAGTINRQPWHSELSVDSDVRSLT